MAKEDGLFLLEVLVDKITFIKSPCFSDRDFKTCVVVSCPKMEPLEICDDDPGVSTRSAGPFTKTFNVGKSCLFSLPAADINAAMSKFPIEVVIFRTLPCGCLPTKIIMGKATIDMTKEFVKARNKYLEDPSGVSYEALRDTFTLLGEDNSETGKICMFLRISCFGKLIVTKFQGAGGQIMLGSGAGGHDRSCNPSRTFQSPDEPCTCGLGRGGGYGGGSHAPGCKASCMSSTGQGGGGGGGGGGVCPPGKDPYATMPCQDPDDPCYCTGPKQVTTTPVACRNTDAYCLHVPKGRSKKYEEIGTNLTGNELKIKVPAASAIIKKISQTHCAIQRPYDKANKKDNTGPCDPPCGRNQISLALPAEDICCKGSALAETQFTCTTEGCTQAQRHGQSAVTRDKGHQEPANRDVYVLKVAKTNLEGDRKCRLELELTAPKAGNKRLPVQTINSMMQSNECECYRRHR